MTRHGKTGRQLLLIIACAWLLLAAGCARPVAMELCDYGSGFLAPGSQPDDFRLFVLVTPPARRIGTPNLDISVENLESGSTTYSLALEKLPSDPALSTYHGGDSVDLWWRYRLTPAASDEYRRLLADVATEHTTARYATFAAQVTRSPAGNIREVRVRTRPGGPGEAVCR